MRIHIQFFVEDPDPGRERKHARGNRIEGGRKSGSDSDESNPSPNAKRASPGAKGSLDRSRGLGDKAGE